MILKQKINYFVLLILLTFIFVNYKLFSNTLKLNDMICIIVVNSIVLIIYDFVMLILTNYFSEYFNDLNNDSNNDPNNLENINKIKNKLINIIPNQDNDFYIILGDYNTIEKLNMVNIENYIFFLSLISKAYIAKKKIKIIIDTLGGSSDSSSVIFRSILDYPYGCDIYVPKYAFSAGTYIVLACDNIYMNPWALLGQTDPQFESINDHHSDTIASKRYIELLNNSDIKLSEKMFMRSIDASIQYDENIKDIIEALTLKNYSYNIINEIINELCYGKYYHGKPFSVKMLKKINLKINCKMPHYINEMYDLISDLKI